jgi:hypothetical protein
LHLHPHANASPTPLCMHLTKSRFVAKLCPRCRSSVGKFGWSLSYGRGKLTAILGKLTARQMWQTCRCGTGSREIVLCMRFATLGCMNTADACTRQMHARRLLTCQPCFFAEWQHHVHLSHQSVAPNSIKAMAGVEAGSGSTLSKGNGSVAGQVVGLIQLTRHTP